jgi:hypothetical protein
MRTLPVLGFIVVSAASIPAAADSLQRGAGPPAGAREVLRQVERAQTEYRAAHGRYTASLRALGIERPADVEVRIAAAGGGGYSAVALAEDEECAVYHGNARPPRSYARTAGRIACRAR